MSIESNGKVVTSSDVVVSDETSSNDASNDVKNVVIKRHDYLFKLIILGDTQAGKTNLLSRFIDDVFHDSSLPTIGVDFKTKIIHIKDKSVKLQIWDTAGKQKYESLSELFYRGVMGVIYCFDLTNKASLKNIDKWIHKLTTSPHYDDRTKCFSAVVGCKSDLSSEREVNSDKGQELAIRLGSQYYECSAKSGENVDNIFQGLSNSILGHQLGWTPDPILSPNSGSRRSPKPSILIRSFSQKAGARTRSFRRSLRRKSFRPKTSTNVEVDEKPRRRFFSESDAQKGFDEKDSVNQRTDRSKKSCAIL